MSKSQKMTVVAKSVRGVVDEETPTPPYWRCPICEELKPLDIAYFPLKPDGLPGKMCLECERTEPERRKKAQQVEQAKQLVRRLVVNSKRATALAPHPVEISAELFQDLGGLKAFCRYWSDQLKLAMENNPGTRAVLDQFAAITRLAGVAAQLQETAPDVSTMSEEALAAEVVRLMGEAAPEAQLAILSADPAETPELTEEN